MKYRSYTGIYGSSYFWRTYNQNEIDLVEEFNNSLNAYEFKLSDKKILKAPKEWIDTYPESTFNIVNNSNYLRFVSGEES
jgi:hypothetical protein